MRHLGAAIGPTNYKNQYIREKIKKWIEELKVLSKIDWIEPQAAYACFSTGFKHKPTYYTRTIPDIANQLTLLDEVVSTEFIPTPLSKGNYYHFQQSWWAWNTNICLFINYWI